MLAVPGWSETQSVPKPVAVVAALKITALALALTRRARDLLLFVPALLAWQAAEGRALWRRARAAG